MTRLFKAKAVTLSLLVATTQLTISGHVRAAGTAPSNIKATSTQGTGTVNVAWSAVSGATFYQARILIGLVPVKTTSNLAPTAQPSYTFVGLDYNVPYTIQVKTHESAWIDGTASPSTITPVAATPSAPSQPNVSVIDDEKLKVTWAAPSSNGGSPISKYSVQLLLGKDLVSEVVVTSLEVELETPDSTNAYSVTVAAINEAALKSSNSEASDPKIAIKPAVALFEVDRPQSGGGNNPASGGGPNSQSPAIDQTTQIVSPSPAIPAYTKVIKTKATTTSRTLVSLSKLATPKGSKTSFSIATSSKKYCQLTGSSVKSLRAGTCSVKVTVTTKTGKKSSRTVKLIAR